MLNVFKVLMIVCGAILCSSCATNTNRVTPVGKHFDLKSEAPLEQICINPSHPYAVVGPQPGTPPLSTVPKVIGKPLAMTRGGK